MVTKSPFQLEAPNFCTPVQPLRLSVTGVSVGYSFVMPSYIISAPCEARSPRSRRTS